MTRADLKAITRKELAVLAKNHEVSGWHAMRKEQLVDALTPLVRRKKGKNQSVRRNGSVKPVSNGFRSTNGPENGSQNHSTAQNGGARKNRRRRMVTLQATQEKLVSNKKNGRSSRALQDQMFTELRDSGWIYTTWRLSQVILDRAEAALGMEWHQAVPVIRVYDVTDNNSTTYVRVNVYDVEIHTHAAECYVPIEGYPRTFQLEIGYKGPAGTFFKLAQSRKVSSVKSRKRDVRPSSVKKRRDLSAVDDYGYVSEMAPRTHSHASAMVVDAIRAQRNRADSANLEDPIQTNGEQGNGSPLNFQVDAELSIHGKTLPFSELTLMGEPVTTAPDGSFSVRFALEEGRQVIPAVMLTPDGNVQHTVVLAIERNTKQLEPRSMNEPL